MARTVNRLTYATIDKPAKGYKIFFFEELVGFGVRVTQAGKRSFIVQGRIKGQIESQEVRITIAPIEVMTFDKAFDLAQANLSTMWQGFDPRYHPQFVASQLGMLK